MPLPSEARFVPTIPREAHDRHLSSAPPRHFEQRNITPTAPLQDRAVNGAPRFLKRQVSDAFYKH